VTGEILSDGTDMRKPMPLIVEGSYEFSSEFQVSINRIFNNASSFMFNLYMFFEIFSKTNKILMDGMCGGAVLASDLPPTRKDVYSERKSTSATVQGCIEGIVPVDHENEDLRGLAVFVGASDIRT
jgi:hypothetical protein